MKAAFRGAITVLMNKPDADASAGKGDNIRTLLKFMHEEWGEEKGTRRYLYQLFPHGYGQQACKIAGMTKPRKLMLDV